MNFPIVESWKDEVWFPNGDRSFVSKLLQILQSSVTSCFNQPDKQVDQHRNVVVNGTKFDDAIAPLLILLRNLAVNDVESRRMIHSLLMPADMYV
jgi:hypothetical protein